MLSLVRCDRFLALGASVLVVHIAGAITILIDLLDQLSQAVNLRVQILNKLLVTGLLARGSLRLHQNSVLTVTALRLGFMLVGAPILDKLLLSELQSHLKTLSLRVQ